MSARAKKKSRKSRMSTLLMIALLLGASGVVRLSSGTGSAIAREIEPLVAVDAPAAVPSMADAADGLESLLTALQAREARIESQETELNDRIARFEKEAADREAAIKSAEAEIARNLEILKAVEAELEATITYASTAAEDDLAKLTAVYENMKPKSAAALFEEMSPEFSAGFLGRMRADAAAAILAGMTSEKAYSVSVILAGRNASIPVE